MPTRVLPVILLALSLLPQSSAHTPLPETQPFMRAVVDALRADAALQAQYAYTEERRDVEISRFGKVTIGPLRRFEVFPSDQPGGTYKRLIAVDGVPLSAEELARRDDEHRADLAREAERRRRESPVERARREAEEHEALEWRARLISDSVAVFEAVPVARETIQGEPVIKVRLTPRPDAQTTTREGGWMKSFSGHAWFSERNHQATGAEMTAHADVSVGWGIVGRLYAGSRLVVTRRLYGDVWLPAHFEFTGSGRTLLFRKFDVAMAATYFDYRPNPRPDAGPPERR